MNKAASPNQSSAAADHRSKARRRQRTTLLAQVIASNALAVAALVFIGVIALNFGIDSQSRRFVLVFLMVSVVFSLLLNILILRRQFGPLDHLIETMEDLDPAATGARVAVSDDATADITDLADSVNDMLQRLESERRKNTRAAVRAQESERARVARELHDEVNQALTAILLRLEASSLSAPPALKQELAETKRLANQAMEELLSVARQLRPTALDIGLRDALEAQIEAVRESTGIEARLTWQGDGSGLSADQELAFYRIAQEALSNVSQHAQATKVTVSLSFDGVTQMTIRDDGQGFSTKGPTDRYGITGMKERALLLDGYLDVASKPGVGTMVRLVLT